MDDNTIVATGRISCHLNNTSSFTANHTHSKELLLNSNDIYKLLLERGYDYRGEFQSIHCINKDLTEAQIFWRNNWVTFIDGMLQLCTLKHSHDGISDPIFVKKITIDTEKQRSAVTTKINDDIVINAYVSEINNKIRCGGVSIEDVEFRNLPSYKTERKMLSLKFAPFFQETKSDITTTLLVYLQIVGENLNKKIINVLQICDDEIEKTNVEKIIEEYEKISLIEVRHKIIKKKAFLGKNAKLSLNYDLIMVINLSKDDAFLQTLNHKLPTDKLLVNIENFTKEKTEDPSELYHIVAEHITNTHRVQLVSWKPKCDKIATTAFTVRTPADFSLLSNTVAVLPEQHRLLIITSHPLIDNLKDLVQKWRRHGHRINVIVINHEIANGRQEEQLPSNNLAFNVLNKGQWGGWFYMPFTQSLSKKSDVSLQCSRIGDLNSLCWVETGQLNGLGVNVNVHYAGVSHIDIKRCSGIIPWDTQNSLGLDFSGVTDSGKRVMGLVSSGAASCRVKVRPELLWPVPEHWSLEEAATVPLAYSLAFYCLCIKYNLEPSKRILVHGGAGALGQAIISIALGIGCEVFTTVNDTNKKRFLLNLFPKLKEKHIGNSRDHTFGDMILTSTNGHGCDLVISCVRDSLVYESMKCTAANGITIDLIQVGTRDNYSFGLYNLTRNRSYATIDFMRVLTEGSIIEIKQLQVMISEGIKRGYVNPITHVVYPTLDAPRAFKHQASSRHRGRALIQLRKNTQEKVTAHFEPRLHCTHDFSQLILCDDKFRGLRIAKRLIIRGARKIYLHGLKESPYLYVELRSLKKFNVEVLISNETLQSNNSVSALLKKCDNFGKIEGIYVDMIDNPQNINGFNTLKELDKLTRKGFPFLKYFGVITNSLNNNIHRFITRATDKLPITLLQLSELKQEKIIDGIDTYEKTIFDDNSIESFEQALTTTEPILLTYMPSKKHQSLLEEIAYLGGIQVPGNVIKTTSLSDLNIGSDKSQIICTYLRNNHNISLSEKDIPDLTIQRILEIEERMSDKGFTNTKGLSTFYSNIDPDELRATTELVFLPTFVNNSLMRDDEIDASEMYLCLIPGLEGHHARFRTLFERLKVPAVVLQPGLEHPDETISSMATRYAKILLKQADSNRTFYLVGYESGALVALEVAGILEDNGLIGTVFFIGESPEKFHGILNRELDDYKDDDELQIATALHMCKLMVSSPTLDKLDEMLRNATSWPERVQMCMSLIFGKIPYSTQYAQELIKCAYGRIKQVQAFKIPQRILHSKLILLKAATLVEYSDDLLQLYSEQPVSVYQLRAPLAHSAADLRCAAIINRHLSDDILESFERRNLCNTYLFRSETFMSTDS